MAPWKGLISSRLFLTKKLYFVHSASSIDFNPNWTQVYCKNRKKTNIYFKTMFHTRFQSNLNLKIENLLYTRKHSSRMHTTCLLTIWRDSVLCHPGGYHPLPCWGGAIWGYCYGWHTLLRMAPPTKDRTPPEQNNWQTNITLPQTSFADGKNKLLSQIRLDPWRCLVRRFTIQFDAIRNYQPTDLRDTCVESLRTILFLMPWVSPWNLNSERNSWSEG